VTNAILGGWTLGDIFTFQTGAPQVILAAIPRSTIMATAA